MLFDHNRPQGHGIAQLSRQTTLSIEKPEPDRALGRLTPTATTCILDSMKKPTKNIRDRIKAHQLIPTHPKKLTCKYCREFFWINAHEFKYSSKTKKSFCLRCLDAFKKAHVRPFTPHAKFSTVERSQRAVAAAVKGLQSYKTPKKRVDKLRLRHYKWGIKVWLPDGPAPERGFGLVGDIMNTSAFTKTETVEVSTKVDEDLYATSKEIPIPANHAELVAAAGEDGVFELALREYMRQQKYELGQKLKDAVAPQDEKPSARRANAKFVEV